jgi:redox-sensitive bicupin YhaK (pirin superfamily)
MGFGPLRVINEDIVAPAQGFGSHPHRDMEIITYVLEGELEHRDSMGHGEVIHAGEVQRMTAGTGVVHSEFNHSKKTPVHLLQIWIVPDERSLAPGYEQKLLTMPPNEWVTVAGKNGEGALKIHQDVLLMAAKISANQTLEYAPKHGNAWVQVARGSVKVDDHALTQGDGAEIRNQNKIQFTAAEDSEVLLFDLPVAGH